MATASLESIIRPFVIVESRPQQTIAPQPITDLETIDAIVLEWGATANFLIPQLDRPIAISFGDNIVNEYGDMISYETGDSFSNQLAKFKERIDDLEEKQPDVEDQEFIFTEIGRTVDVVRITKTVSDVTLWVDVERILTITFRAPNGEALTYELNHGDA